MYSLREFVRTTVRTTLYGGCCNVLTEQMLAVTYFSWRSGLDTLVIVVITKLSEEISDLIKLSQVAELESMEMKDREKLKRMRKSMKGQVSRWDSDDLKDM